MVTVLVLDANQRSALAATRSLGGRGIHVIAADETRETLAGSSRYCSETMQYPSPTLNDELFIEQLSRKAAANRVSVIFPMTEVTTRLLLMHREQFKGMIIPFSTLEAFELLSSKWRLHKLAEELNVPIPFTVFVESKKDLERASASIKFPAVLKPYGSKIHSDGKWLGATVRYVNSLEELYLIVKEDPCFNEHPFMIQEKIEGIGEGVFALYDRGRPVQFFAHRRLREKPPTGGVSVLCESIALNPRMQELACTILTHVRWHGIAMVEFKVSADGMPYLMEVNARFWGSLHLAIQAGVDFPYLLYKLAIGDQVEELRSYRIGLRNRWVLGDLDNLYISWKEGLLHQEVWASILRRVRVLEKDTCYETCMWDDLSPFWFEVRKYVREVRGSDSSA